MLEGRLGPGNDVMGNRTTDHDYVGLRKSLKKRPLDYFKNDFWADTAAFTAEPATKCGMEFFPIDKIVFASDCPFDPEGGTMFSARDLAHPRQAEDGQDLERQGLLQEPRSHHRQDAGEVIVVSSPAKICFRGEEVASGIVFARDVLAGNIPSRTTSRRSR